MQKWEHLAVFIHTGGGGWVDGQGRSGSLNRVKKVWEKGNLLILGNY
jgi:hypothetical protein